jgi:hypothetical protein
MCHQDYEDSGFHEYSDRYCPDCADRRDAVVSDLERIKFEHRDEIDEYRSGGRFPDFSTWR